MKLLLGLTPDSDTNWSTNCHFRGSSEELVSENISKMY